jgi:hypothetical protein
LRPLVVGVAPNEEGLLLRQTRSAPLSPFADAFRGGSHMAAMQQSDGAAAADAPMRPCLHHLPAPC